MSDSVDNRVVSMQFDNARFERNVGHTMKTLASLKKGLDFSSSVKGLANLQKAGDRFDLSGISSSLDMLVKKFSTTSIMGITSIANLTNSAINAGRRMVSALTIQPLTTGFSEYELKMNSVQTIMSSTGKSLEEVNGYLEELNAYSDRTIYSFQDMTSNIGKFTNAGVSLDDAVMAIKGISNEAAVSGANANEASRAMYNFSQALSSGVIRLIDWKSIENANMATKEFKQNLLDTALKVGTVTQATDGMYKAGKTTFDATQKFNDSLQEQWMTSEVLIETLKQYSDETTDIGKKAYAAAQDVKTFSQLYDTLKEAAQSGWAQSWEILVGDLTEAKSLLTAISNVVGGMIGKSAEARNNLLKGWDALGGRMELLDAGAKAFDALKKSMWPVKWAFREFFPKTTADQLYNLTHGISEFAKKLEVTPKLMGKINQTFKGVFAVLDIGKQAVKSLFGVVKPLFSYIPKGIDAVLTFTSKLGGMLVKLNKAIKDGDLFGKTFSAIGKVLSPITNILKNGITSVLSMSKEIDFKGIASRVNIFGESFAPFEAIGNMLSKMFEKIGSGIEWVMPKFEVLGSKISSALSKARDAIVNTINEVQFDKGFDIVNGGIFATILVGIQKFVGSLGKIAKNGEGFLGGLKDIVSGVTGIFEGFQSKLKADALIKIAKAIAILAGSLILMSFIDSERMASALAGLGAMMGELYLFMKLTSGTFAKMNGSKFGAMAAGLTAVSTAILTLSGAVAILSAVDSDGLLRGLFAVGVLLTEIGVFSKAMSMFKPPKLKGFMGFATSLVVMSGAIAILGHIDTDSLKKGLISVGLIMAGVTAMSKFAGSGLSLIALGAGLGVLSASLYLFAGAVAVFAAIPKESFGKGLLMIAGSLLAIAGAGAAIGLVGPLLVSAGVALTAFAAGAAIAGAGIGIFTVALSAAALAAGTVFAIFGTQFKSIGKSMLKTVGVLALVSVAFTLLSPVMLIAGAAASVLGLGLMAIAKSVAIFAAAMGALAVSGEVGSAALVASVENIVSVIPKAFVAAGNGIIAMANVIIEGAPVIGTAITTVILAIVSTLAESAPVLVNGGLQIIASILSGIANNIGEVTIAGVKVILNFLQGVATALPMIIDGGISVIVSFINGMANGLREHSETLFLAMGNLISAIVEMALTGLQLIVQEIPGIGDNMAAGLETAKEKVRETLTSEEMLNSGKEAMGKIAEGAQSGIAETEGTFSQAGEMSVENFSDWMSKNAYLSEYAGKKVGSEGASGAGSMVGNFRSSGLNSATGFANGMRDGVNTVHGAAAEMAQSALDAVHRVLDEHSPSREMGKAGMNADLGFANAVTDYSYTVEDSCEELGGSALKSLQSTMSNLGKLVEGEMDTAPTIRPVLDLSSVRNGSKLMSTMIGSTVPMNLEASEIRASAISSRMKSFTSAPGCQNKDEPASIDNSINYYQYNTSPKALRRIDIYRDTSNLLAARKGEIDRHVKTN